MLPPSLSSTYQRYKQDTNIVASWLASTALACGYAPDRLKNPAAAAPAPSSSGRLKGKDRKEAKRAKQQQGSQETTKRPKHIIAVADFVTLAEFIASSKSSSASLPDFFIGALSRVISLRSSFRDRMSQEGMAEDAASDKTHNYFTKILVQVRTTLKPLMPTTQTENLPSLNRFENLKLYEPSQAFLDAPAPAPSKPDKNQPPTSDASYVAEQSSRLEEVIFAWTVMTKDLTALRNYIKAIWLEHRNGFFDAAVAALATNTAVDLARSIMDEVLPLAEQHGGCWLIAQCFHRGHCLGRGLDPHDYASTTGTYGTYDIASDTLVATYTLLGLLPEYLDERPIPSFKEWRYFHYDPAKDRQSLSGEEKACEDKAILLHLVADLITVVRLLPEYPVEDELLRGMKELDRTRKVSFALAFAAQVHVDIHHVLREHAPRARTDLLQASRVLDDEITAFLDFHKSVKSKAWPQACDKTLLALQQQMRWVRADPIHHVKVKALKEMGRPYPPDSEKHKLLAVSPVIAGLLLFRFRAHSWKMAMLVNKAWGTVLYSAHLFDALENERVINPGHHWQDMDVAKNLFGHDQFYVGDRPKSRLEYLSKFCLSVGVSAAFFAQRGKSPKDRPKNYKAPMAKAGGRYLKGDLPVSQMFFARYLEKSGQIDWTPEHVGDILARSRWEVQINEKGEPVLVESGKSQKLRRQDAAAQVLLSPEELILKLALSLQAESLEMTFLYLKMHRECFKFLWAIREACQPLLLQVYTPSAVVEKTEPTGIVNWVLTSLNGGFGRQFTESLLQRCANVVDTMASSGDGAVVCRAMGDLGFSTQHEVTEGGKHGNLVIDHKTPSLALFQQALARQSDSGGAVDQQA